MTKILHLTLAARVLDLGGMSEPFFGAGTTLLRHQMLEKGFMSISSTGTTI